MDQFGHCEWHSADDHEGRISGLVDGCCRWFQALGDVVFKTNSCRSLYVAVLRRAWREYACSQGVTEIVGRGFPAEVATTDAQPSAAERDGGQVVGVRKMVRDCLPSERVFFFGQQDFDLAAGFSFYVRCDGDAVRCQAERLRCDGNDSLTIVGLGVGHELSDHPRCGRNVAFSERPV